MWTDAIDLCSYGFKIFPLQQNSKIPAISKVSGGNGCLDATDDEEIISEWAKKYPDANLGIGCGETSGIVVIDVDVKDGAGGEESMRRLKNAGVVFGETAEVVTPSGGRHLYYSYNERLGKNSAGKIAKGIDIRSNGGYVVCPPSIIDGTRYKWIRGPDAIKKAPVMQLLFATRTAPKQIWKRRDRPQMDDNSQQRLCRWVEARVPGERNNSLFWAACRHAEKNWSVDGLYAVGRNLGLDSQEVERTIKSGLKRGGRNGV